MAEQQAAEANRAELADPTEFFAEEDPVWAAVERMRVAEDVDWRERLQLSKDGKPLSTISNVITILRYHEHWRGVLGYDMFGERLVKLKDPPWDPGDLPADPRRLRGEWVDEDTTLVMSWLARKEFVIVGKDTADAAVQAVAETNSFHPVRDYLRALKWDGVQRLEKILPTYFNTEDSEYTRGVGKRWMISAVARIMQPGCQVDCVMILEGPQGYGKSTALRELTGGDKWYSDTPITIGDKDSYQALRHVWVFALDELDSLKRSELTRTKSFISSRVDRYRPSFGRRAKDFPRQCVFVGSTNESEYLADPTGNRRFWPVTVERRIDWTPLQRDRDQLWAEAVAAYDAGEPWHVDTDEFRTMCEDQQGKRIQHDPWEDRVAEWLQNPRARETLRPIDITDGVEATTALEHAVGKRMDSLTKFDQMRMCQVFRTLGWGKAPLRTVDGRRVRAFVPPTAQPAQPPL